VCKKKLKKKAGKVILLPAFLFSKLIIMMNNPITQQIISTIEKEIYQDFENFIKSVNIPKN
jgi:hypothetical protein